MVHKDYKMKKLLLGLSILASMSSFSAIEVVCGDEMYSTRGARISLNDELSKERYSNAMIEVGDIEFSTRTYKVQVQGMQQLNGPTVFPAPSYRQAVTACIVIKTEQESKMTRDCTYRFIDRVENAIDDNYLENYKNTRIRLLSKYGLKHSSESENIFSDEKLDLGDFLTDHYYQVSSPEDAVIAKIKSYTLKSHVRGSLLHHELKNEDVEVIVNKCE